MSRFTASLVLVASLFTGLASAETRFAAPPAESAELRVAPPQVDRAKVRAALIANRNANLARFRAYYRAGKYPSNVYADGLTNVWRDEDGRLCAAATIMKASGEGALVEKIAEQNNFIKLADVTQGPVLDWILTSGFTQAELVAIQKPFQRVGQIEFEEQAEQLKPIAVIDPTLRTDETVRLTKLYRRVDARMMKTTTTSLDLAVERLMKRPDLAKKLVGTSVSP
ncbi:MAG TPA: hypothetical protein VIU61_08030 [Kofleriaceae bacterium]